ncbi:MAG TPA: hypothetical protein VD962_07320 [Rubricoccaceae bacterium]|nr:hypothetical protein [Rubricoccaceae bacterium]
MGKAILLLVASFGIVGGGAYFSSLDAETRTAQTQANYEEDVLAREIARSALNVGHQILRRHGTNLVSGRDAINGSGQGRSRGKSGIHQGGRYRVVVDDLRGNAVRITAEGTFGRARHVIVDDYVVPVLFAQQLSQLKVRFLESQAGYCSAIFLQRWEPGLDVPSPPEMLFAASHNSDYDTLTVNKTIRPGTQMNFFIGVDQNCSTRPGGPSAPSSTVRAYPVQTHVYNAADYDYVHPALDVQTGHLDEMRESMWALIEPNRTQGNRWRIGWEDIHNPAWNNPNSNNPANSIQALKRLGYDATGWPSTPDRYGYRTLRDGGLDLSDQVIEVWLAPVTTSTSGTSDGGGTGTGGTGTGGTGTGDTGGTGTGGTGTGDTGGTGTGTPPPCACPGNGNQNHKVQIRHFPPGNRNNPQTICIALSAWNTHRRHHGDHIVCTGL